MNEATISSRGRATIPLVLRERLGLVPGTRLLFTELVDGSILVRRSPDDMTGRRGLFVGHVAHASGLLDSSCFEERQVARCASNVTYFRVKQRAVASLRGLLKTEMRLSIAALRR